MSEMKREVSFIIDKKEIKVSKDGYFVFGLGRDKKNDVIISIKKNERSKNIKTNLII